MAWGLWSVPSRWGSPRRLRPRPCPTHPGPCLILSGTQFVGNVSVGQTFTIVFTPACAFDDGATVTIVVNGVNVGVRIAVNGTVSITVTVVSVTTLSINPLAPAVCGLNVATATGFSSAARAVVTQTATFNLLCPGAPGPPGPPVPRAHRARRDRKAPRDSRSRS